MKSTAKIFFILLIASTLDAQNQYRAVSLGYGSAGVFDRYTRGLSYSYIYSIDPISLRLGSDLLARKNDLSLYNFQLLATAGFLQDFFGTFELSLFTGPTFIANQIEPRFIPESSNTVSSRTGFGIGWNVNSALIFYPLERLGFGIEAQKTFSRFGNTTGAFLIFRFRNKHL